MNDLLKAGAELSFGREDVAWSDFTFTMGVATENVALTMTQIGIPDAPPGYLLPARGVGAAILPAEDPKALDAGRPSGGIMFGPDGFEGLIRTERERLGFSGPHPDACELYAKFCERRRLGFPGGGVKAVPGAILFYRKLRSIVPVKVMTAWATETVQCYLAHLGLTFTDADIFGSEQFPRDRADPRKILDKDRPESFLAAAERFERKASIMIDDHPRVVLAAIRAGIPRILAILNPLRKVEDYVEAAAEAQLLGAEFTLVPDFTNVTVIPAA